MSSSPSAEQIARDARWIFHIGHVGSTLISRLLGELPGVLAVREPRSLRNLSFCGPDDRARFVDALQPLMSRRIVGLKMATENFSRM